MEEDIKHLEKRIDLNRQMYLEFGRLLSLDEETVNAIENLINKNKELETMVELMILSISSYDSQLVINNFKNKEDVKEFFRKKAKGE